MKEEKERADSDEEEEEEEEISEGKELLKRRRRKGEGGICLGREKKDGARETERKRQRVSNCLINFFFFQINKAKGNEAVSR